jgi:hypothetical protein
MRSKKFGIWTTLVTSIWASCALAETATFESGQLWECTLQYKTASPDQRLQFLVTGIATQREVSRRPNFQNDERVISVALTDLDPMACPQAKRFLHMAYSEEGLLSCSPRLIEHDNRLASPNSWKAARDARGKWLIGMQSNKGVLVSLNPSRFLALVSKKRCQ